ncbi:hypothetical protein [Helicobacter cetorum]|nr:hypothetical protein [Helicobacter cetorum]
MGVENEFDRGGLGCCECFEWGVRGIRVRKRKRLKEVAVKIEIR